MERPGRVALLLSAVALLFLLLLTRLTQLMLFARATQGKAASYRRYFEVLPARRGNIFDRNGIALAVTVPYLEIGLDPQIFPREKATREKCWHDLEPILGVENCQLGQKKLDQVTQSRWIKIGNKLSEQRYEKLLSLKIPGVYGQRNYLRLYPQKSLGAHLLGFVNRENVACCGLEKFLDFFLRGQDGWLVSEKDGRRQELVQHRTQDIAPVDGCDVYLTMDVQIQQQAELELQSIAEKYKPEFAVIIISEAKTGRILALACHPNFDPNLFYQSPIDQLRNRAVTDVYEPGSVFKIIVTSAGLEEGIVTPESRFDCSQKEFFYNNRRYKLPKDYALFGELSFVDVLRKSSNRSSAQIGIMLGADKFFHYVQAFGFGERTGYGFDGEVPGILHPPTQWDGLTITRMPMGHAIAVTPLQMHMAMGILACDGYLLAPQVVRKIVWPAATGREDLEQQPIFRRKVLRKWTVSQMRSALSNPTDRIHDWEIACKTGTTQKIVNGRYVHNRHIASCSGFFPSNAPRFVITVVVDSPVTEENKTAWGSRFAKPSFKRLAEYLLNNGT